MKILKYKKLSNNKYKVFLENNETITLHENIIIKYNLLLLKKIDDINEILKENSNYLVYDLTLKYISTKMRCESELREYLKKKNIDNDLINTTILKLKKDGYLDEKLYVRCFISDKIRLNRYGINKIRNELLKLNIDKNIIDEELSNIDKAEINENLERIIDKKIKANKNYAGEVLKQRILSDLFNKGYSKEEILSILSKKDLSRDDIYEREYNKLYNKYKNKYEKEKLEYFINQKLYQKGIKKNNS